MGKETTNAGGGIPKHIHQIWLGKNPRPDLWIDTVKDFAKQYGYEYTLWTEDNSATDLDWAAHPEIKDLYASFSKELAGKADIIRLLALYKYGGLYIDADTVIMKPRQFMEFLDANKAEVFFGWENLTAERTRKLGSLGPGMRGERRLVANGIIGTQAQHPFFEALLEGLVANAKLEKKGQAWRAVGPLYVSRMYKKLKGRYPGVKVYPMKYFYPLHWKGITDPLMHKKVQIPKVSMLFQYGYSTNSFDKIFRERAKRAKGGATRRKGRGVVGV